MVVVGWWRWDGRVGWWGGMVGWDGGGGIVDTILIAYHGHLDYAEALMVLLSSGGTELGSTIHAFM